MKRYYKNLDLFRLLSCIAVLLYHLGYLKGGYLAVCSFFVLSGYLSCLSAFKEEKFNFKKYYKNKFLHLYLPLLAVVFLTVFVLSFIPSINWLNLKPETNSVLLGYNNFWQLAANLDYFAAHVDSPFMHLWYIAILFQFDLVFPFIFIIFKKIGDKIGKTIPIALTFLLGVASYAYFYEASLSNITVAYYSTFSRVFALFFGMMIAFLSHYCKKLTPKKFDHTSNQIVFTIYLLIWIALMILGAADSEYFQIYMILTTLITMRLINYAVLNENALNKSDKVVKFFSDISYEIYLVQYPVIFIFQEIELELPLKIALMIIVILLLSFVLHYLLDFKKYARIKALKILLQILLFLVLGYGIYSYIISEDHTAEMKALEEQLNQNAKLMEERQEEYALKLKEEQEKWDQMLADLDSSEENIKVLAKEAAIVGLGDSIMLGAVPELSKHFPNSYFDADTSRTCYVANDILKTLIKKNMVGDIIIFNFGANGDCPNAIKDKIMKTIGNRELFWLNVTNDKKVHFNDKITKYAENYGNLHVVDWATISSGHKEYFIADGVHLTSTGKKAFVQAIYDAIYKFYLDEFNAKKEEILKKHEEELKTRISFYGNELLLNAYDYLQEEFKDHNFTINKDFNFEELKAELEKSIEDKSLASRVVLAFDTSFKITNEEYKSIINLLGDCELIIVKTSNKKINVDNVKIIDFYEETFNNSDYLMVDKIHLTDKGNKALTEKLVEILKDNRE